MGPLTLWGLLGWFILLVAAFKQKEKKLLVLLIFPGAYFLYIDSWYTKFIRYVVPILPFLDLFAAWLLTALWTRHRNFGLILISSTILLTCLWSLAFFSIYTKEPTRITASRWIYQNIPPEDKILTEHWDDGLPLPLPGPKDPSEYKTEALTIYEPDNQEKIRYYAQKLSGADYLVISSRRLYGTLMYLPEKYPITSRYYRLLFNGQLGYQKVAQFAVYPSLLGLEINDDGSEETFQVYEHPKVMIFQNRQHLSEEVLIQKLAW